MKQYEKRAEILNMVEQELLDAQIHYHEMQSYHEGYAILKEEVDELWDEIKKRPKVRDDNEIRHEAIQVAAMAVRFLLDLC